MDFKNYRSLNIKELDKYLSSLEKEYDKVRAKINKLCDSLAELDEEYTSAKDELEKRHGRE